MGFGVYELHVVGHELLEVLFVILAVNLLERRDHIHGPAGSLHAFEAEGDLLKERI